MEEDFIKAIRYIANECQKSPDDSVRDICNEAFERCDLPFNAHWSSDSREPIMFVRS